MERSIDKEKVMTWLEICGKNNDCSGCCPYSENGFGEYGRCRESLMADAYDMLKEQQAVEPINSYGTFRCGNCRNIVGYNDGHGRGYQNNFCSKCGKKVKWNG